MSNKIPTPAPASIKIDGQTYIVPQEVKSLLEQLQKQSKSNSNDAFNAIYKEVRDSMQSIKGSVADIVGAMELVKNEILFMSMNVPQLEDQFEMKEKK